MSSRLFSPLVLRSVEFHNRIFVSPMCQYSSENGMPNDWHFVHLGSRAVGGASMVCVEASGVTPEGRITPWDAGIWSDAHAMAWGRVARFLRDHGAVPAIQIAHAGRKASCDKPWKGGKPLAMNEGGWQTLGPSNVAEFYHERGFTSSSLSHKDFPLQKATLGDLAGSDRASNAEIVRAIVHGKDRGPKRDAVLLNASAALLVGGRVKSLTEGWTLAETVIDRGAAAEKLEQLRKASK